MKPDAPAPLASISIAAPHTDAVRAFYRDFGLVETAPGRFAAADSGEQLRIELFAVFGTAREIGGASALVAALRERL